MSPNLTMTLKLILPQNYYFKIKLAQLFSMSGSACLTKILFFKDGKLSNCWGGEGGTGSLTDKRRQHSLLGTAKPTWCCHGMEGTSDT